MEFWNSGKMPEGLSQQSGYCSMMWREKPNTPKFQYSINQSVSMPLSLGP
jgi:hypothetical protein